MSSSGASPTPDARFVRATGRSGWPGLTSAFGEDHKLAYSPLVLPMTIAGVKVVIVGHELETLEPRFFRFLMAFAQDNELQTMAAPDALAAPQSLRPPVPTVREPREPV